MEPVNRSVVGTPGTARGCRKRARCVRAQHGNTRAASQPRQSEPRGCGARWGSGGGRRQPRARRGGYGGAPLIIAVPLLPGPRHGSAQRRAAVQGLSFHPSARGRRRARERGPRTRARSAPGRVRPNAIAAVGPVPAATGSGARPAAPPDRGGTERSREATPYRGHPVSVSPEPSGLPSILRGRLLDENCNIELERAIYVPSKGLPGRFVWT
jgi:hypothetical protein